MDPRELLEAFLTPQKVRELSREEILLQRAETYSLRLGGSGFARGGGDEVRVYHWGAGPKALLIHGWCSRAAHLEAMITALEEKGWGVTAFDAPGHGRSGGTFSSAPAFAAAIEAIALREGPFEAVVAHSLGTVAAALTLDKTLQARKAVLLSSCCWVEPLAVAFAQAKGASAEEVQAMLAVAHAEFRPEEISAELSAPALGSVATLLMHDPGDAEMPYAHSSALAAAWPGAVLVETPGMGHRRILRAREIIERTLRHITP